jgi:HEAT repeat protein
MATLGLRRLGPKAQRAIPALIQSLSDEDESVAQYAAQALVAIGPASVPPLTRQLDSKDPRVRFLAAESLGWLDAAPQKARRVLMEALRNGTAARREQAITVLAHIRDEATLDLILHAADRDADEQVRGTAVWALGEFGVKGKKAVPLLITILKDPASYPWLDDPFGSVREFGMGRATTAVHSLAKIGPESVNALLALMKDRHAHRVSRLTAGNTLATIRPDASVAVVPLLPLLHDPEEVIRQKAAMVLGMIGQTAKDAVPSLLNALKDPSPRVRIHAAVALYRITPTNTAIIPALSRSLRDPDREVRWLAAVELGNIGPGAAGAVGALTEALHDSEARNRAAMAEALGLIGPSAVKAIPALTMMLRDGDEVVRNEAGKALVRIRRDDD